MNSHPHTHTQGFLPKDTSYLGPYEVLPIHKCPDLVSQCCRLINAEWPRSEVARMRSLQASSDSLPTNLVLTRDYRETVLAHVKLSPIPSRPNGCFIESMVVRKILRGQGLGKLLMKYAEDYAADYLRCDEMYLSTIDSIGFYEKQRYVLCQPVNMYGLSMGYVPQSNNKQKVYMKKMLK